MLDQRSSSKTHLAIKRNEKEVKFYLGGSSPDAPFSWEQSALEAVCPRESPAHSFLAGRPGKRLGLSPNLSLARLFYP